MKIPSLAVPFPLTRRIAFGCVLVAVIGCSAGPRPARFVGTRRNVPVDTPPTRARAVLPEREPQAVRERVLDLGSDFYRDDAGRVLARSIGTHGGWDRWRSKERVDYALVRRSLDAVAAGIAEEREGAGPAGERLERRRIRHSWSALESFLTDPATSGTVLPDFGAGAEGLGSGGSAETAELQAFALPHILAASRFRVEYIGIENDVRAGARFEKCRYRIAGAPQSAGWLLVYFDATTARVERVVTCRPDGTFLRVLFDDWSEVEGVEIPRLRKVFHLERTPYRHRDENAPDWIQTLEDIDVEVREQ